jgi:hypothetical protein
MYLPGGSPKAAGLGDGQVVAAEAIPKLLRIPEPLQVECIIALGYPAEKREPVRREELKKAKIHSNTYAP